MVRRIAPILGIVMVLGLGRTSSAQTRIAGRWLGQDGHDHCGATGDAIKPNGYQDVHIVLHGLPPRKEIASAKIRGFGSGEWQYNGARNNYGAVILRKPGGMTADVFFEPDRVETGRPFNVALKFDDGTEAVADVKGGKANPDLPMPAFAMSAHWVGQERVDHAGSGPGVGPDGLQDVRIGLAKLNPKARVTAVLVEGPTGSRWAFGVNREGFHNAEFFPDAKDPSKGDLLIHPENLDAGQSLKVTVTYETGKSDSAVVVAGRGDPKLPMPKASLAKLATVTVDARWLGQDGSAETGWGDVHLAISGLPTRRVVAAVLSDSVGAVWAFNAGGAPGLNVEGGAAPLVFKSKGTAADLFFAPVRDESKSTLTLRLVFADGDSAVATIAGGECDPGRRALEVEKTEVVAKPGDDLNKLVNRVGTVRLTKGNYTLNTPLVLNKPVSVIGEPGAVLTFSYPRVDLPWTAAVKVHAGNTTLRGFAIRFAGPVRWRNDVGWGPAVIGTTDQFDKVPNAPKYQLVFERLDVEGPPPSGKAPWEEAVKLMRLNNAACGRIANNVLRGGLVEFFGGPWQVVENDFRGTPAGTYSYSVFAAHDPYDLVMNDNKARPVGPGGKVWRFVVMTGRGALDRLEGNTIQGLGPRDDDTRNDNSPEIILTESYHLCFEGKASAVSADGRLVRVGPLRGREPRTGDVVSVVAGAGAGQWRRIAQRIEPTVYFLDAPLPKGADVLSVSAGFVNETYARNSVDARDGRGAGCLVLAGNHFGARVVNNRFLGAGDAFRLVAFPSETPSIWGWSHVPFFGAMIEENVIEDSERGGSIGVDHGPAVKANKGRVYMTATVKNNIVRWSAPFLSHFPKADAKRSPTGITLGVPGSIDPGELVVTESGDRLDSPSQSPSNSAFRVNAAVLNGKPYTNRSFTLPAATAASTTGR